MSDHDWLRDGLRDAVPPPPPAPTRAEGVRTRVASRRRTATIASVAAAAAVVAAVAVPFSVAGDSQTTPPVSTPTPTTTPTTASPEPDAVACPPPTTEPTGPKSLPTGAVAVRLCDGPGMGFDEPPDALVSGVDALVEVVNTQPIRMDNGGGCTADLGRGYLLAFAYPDGEVQVVSGELYGCHELVVGGTVRDNPERPWQRFIDLLREQRAAGTPSRSITVPACADTQLDDATGTSVVGDPADMKAAVLCVRYQTATKHPALQIDVPAADLAVLLADRAARAHPAEPVGDCGPTTPSWQLVGRTAWGDLTMIDAWCGQWSDYRGHYWDPGAEAQAVIDHLVEEAGSPLPTVDAGSTAEEVVAAYVDFLNAGDRDGARALLHRLAQVELPTSYSRIDFTVEGARPLRFISAYGEATAVTALYREVPTDGSWVDYREARFVVGRDEDGQFRIVNVEIGEVVPTGR
jgi:hypothetical protein